MLIILIHGHVLNISFKRCFWLLSILWPDYPSGLLQIKTKIAHSSNLSCKISCKFQQISCKSIWAEESNIYAWIAYLCSVHKPLGSGMHTTYLVVKKFLLNEWKYTGNKLSISCYIKEVRQSQKLSWEY